MRFSFTPDQRRFAEAVRAVFHAKCNADALRSAWSSETGRVPGLWHSIGELGLLAAAVPEAQGGLGMSAVDLVLVFEESGRVAVPEPLVETVAVAGPLLSQCAGVEEASEWLSRLVEGDLDVAVVFDIAPHAVCPESCGLAIVEHEGALVAASSADFSWSNRRSVDGSRRLAGLGSLGTGAVVLTRDAAMIRRAKEHAIVAVSAQLCGLAARMLDMTVEYARVREQFGRPIGSFQAVQHRLADALLALEFARPTVYRAAHSLTVDDPETSMHVAMAKVYASDAAAQVAKAALQVHGAIGYSTEYDLHLFMKRAWALAASYGDAGHHRRAVASMLLGDDP